MKPIGNFRLNFDSDEIPVSPALTLSLTWRYCSIQARTYDTDPAVSARNTVTRLWKHTETSMHYLSSQKAKREWCTKLAALTSLISGCDTLLKYRPSAMIIRENVHRSARINVNTNTNTRIHYTLLSILI
jgi:hypothetical protein